tara:strand:+ start:223 stop:513 length:291 start_codon:yes stop_codon:yes gene_type:complete
MDLDDFQIQKILTSYKRKREKERERYQSKKDDPEFIIKNRERAHTYYIKHRDETKEKYKQNASVKRARSLYHYYDSQGRGEEFKTKYPEKIPLLKI